MEPAAVEELLRRYRARSGLSREALAEQAGLSVEAIRMLETGRRRRPRQPTITRLAAALSLSPAEVEEFQQAATGTHRPVTTDLPLDLDDFTGRSAQVGQLTELLAEAVGRAVTLSAIGGMGGVGKTVLAVHTARLMADRFPDGSLYLNLRGSRDPLTSLEALTILLQSLDVPAGDIPDELDRASARYRTALAGKRVLLLLDDAADSNQVIPLIPGTAGCSALVTSRDSLTALPGAHHLALEVLSENESLELLAEIIGADLVNADPTAAIDLVRRCGCLPLALRVAAGQLVGGSAADLAALATRLGDQARLDVLTSPEVSVRSTIALSIDALATSKRSVDQAAAKALPLCALIDGDSFPLRLAAAVLELSLADAEDVLERLVDVHLLETPALHRYRLHDLVAEVGREHAHRTLTGDQRQAAWERVLRCYMSMLWRAEELFEPRRELGPGWPDPAWAAPAADLTNLTAILEWLDGERFALVAAIKRAASAGSADDQLTAIRMAVGLIGFTSHRRRWTELRDAIEAVIDLLDELTDPVPKAKLLVDLGNAYGGFQDYATALKYHERGLEYVVLLNNPQLEGALLVNLSYGLQRVGRSADGLARAQQALALATTHHQPGVESAAHLMIGSLAGETGDFTLQSEAFGRAAQPLRDKGQPTHLAHRLRFIAESLRECGRHQEALVMLQECVQLHRLSPDRADGFLAETLSDLGAVSHALGRYDEALAQHAEALEIAIEHDISDQQILIRTRIGETHTAAGRPDDARTEWRQALALCEKHGAPTEHLLTLLDA